MNKRPSYIINEPWPDRLYVWTCRHIVCPVLGHKWQRKMHDRVCDRCRYSEWL